MSDCLFCKIIHGEIPCEKIYEDEHTLAFLTIKPNNEGHTLVIPKNHFVDALSIPQEAYLHVMRTVHRLSPIIQKVTQADGININTNNGAGAGQVIFHLHIHIIPRYANDGYHAWHPPEHPHVPLRETRRKILAALES